VIDSAAQFMPPRPPVYHIKNKNGAYYKMVLEVKNIIDSLTPEQKHIADFWDDSPFRSLVSGHFSVGLKKFSPPGHWLNIVGIAAMNSKADFNTTVYAYAKTAIALFDGFISCWDEKYRSVYVRPETVINKYMAPEWRPYIETPPFPEYTSGHSVISAAAAEALTSVFGDNIAYRDSSEAEFGIKDRSFTSFRQAAIEASYSRMYGGIHFRPALENGNLQGKKLGEYLNGRLRMKRVTK
jgi:PAP2 superfamily